MESQASLTGSTSSSTAASSAAAVFYNPTLPHVSVIPDGMFPGRAVVIKGVVLDSSSSRRFSVDFCCGLLVSGDHTDNKALHFNPRFDSSSWLNNGDQDIVLNSLINNRWGAEERYANVFKTGQAFQLRILALKDYFKIAINGRHLCDYLHRVPLGDIQTIYIAGGIQIDFIEYQGEVNKPVVD